MENQKQYEIKALLNIAGATQAATGSPVEVTPSASIGKREMKVIVPWQVLTAGTFPLSVSECATTNGTFTACGGDSLANVTATQAAQGVTEAHIQVTKRYVKAQIGTVAGSGATANIAVLLQNLKRYA
jgi:hypothetical protein